MTKMTRLDYAVVYDLTNTHTPTPDDSVEGTQEGKSLQPSGDVPVKFVGFMSVSSTAARGSGIVCTGAQREPEQVEPLGA